MRMESHLIWNRKPTENMHDYAMLLCIFKAILRGWSLNCYSHVQNLRTMSHGWLIHSIPRPKNETPTGFDTYLFSNINYAPGTLRPHMCCARVFFPPLLQESSKHTNQIKSVNSPWAVFNKLRPTEITPAYPEISRNKEYANPHVSKNMQKHPAGLEMGRVKTAFSCDWQEVNHAFHSVFSCFDVAWRSILLWFWIFIGIYCI